MPVQSLFGTTIQLLGKTLDLRTKRHELIASNLANVETPNYTPTDLSFDKELQDALNQKRIVNAEPNPQHIPLKGQSGYQGLQRVTGDVIEVPSSNLGPDGNGVEMETEMQRLAQNQIMYNTSVQLLNKKFEMLAQAIKGTL
jgi:flagellar basal-body rod protein FlgB